MLSILSGKYLRVEFLGHIVVMFNFMRNCQTVFSPKAVIPFYTPTCNEEEFYFLHIFANTWYRQSFHFQPLVVESLCLAVVLICMLLVTNSTEYLLTCLLTIYTACFFDLHLCYLLIVECYIFWIRVCPLSNKCANIFSHCIQLAFFVMVSFEELKVLYVLFFFNGYYFLYFS